MFVFGTVSICISYNTGKSACVITNIYHFRHSEKLPKPEGKLPNSGF